MILDVIFLTVPARRINSFGVIETLADVMLARDVPEHIRSDNGSEMTASIMPHWLASLGTKTLYIETRQSLGKRLLRVLQRPAR